MPAMKSTSASVYGSRPSPGGVAWRPRAGAPAHAAAVTARSRYTTLGAHDRMLFPPRATHPSSDLTDDADSRAYFVVTVYDTHPPWGSDAIAQEPAAAKNAISGSCVSRTAQGRRSLLGAGSIEPC